MGYSACRISGCPMLAQRAKCARVSWSPTRPGALARGTSYIPRSALLTVVIFVTGLVMGALLRLPGATSTVILQGSGVVIVTAILTTALVLPFALIASIGRGYLLPIGLAVLTVMATNLVVIVGRGEYFPWAVPGLYSQAKDSLTPVSFALVMVTSLAGMFATYLWWKYHDQNR